MEDGEGAGAASGQLEGEAGTIDLERLQEELGDLHIEADRLEFVSELGVGELALVERGVYHIPGGRVRCAPPVMRAHMVHAGPEALIHAPKGPHNVWMRVPQHNGQCIGPEPPVHTQQPGPSTARAAML